MQCSSNSEDHGQQSEDLAEAQREPIDFFPGHESHTEKRHCEGGEDHCHRAEGAGQRDFALAVLLPHDRHAGPIEIPLGGCGLSTVTLGYGVWSGLGRGNGFDVGFDVVHALKPKGWVVFEGTQHDFVQAHVHGHLPGGWNELADGKFAGEHFIKHDTQGKNVGAMIDGTWRLDLLGSHVMGSAMTWPSSVKR